MTNNIKLQVATNKKVQKWYNTAQDGNTPVSSKLKHKQQRLLKQCEYTERTIGEVKDSKIPLTKQNSSVEQSLPEQLQLPLKAIILIDI